LAQPSYGNSIIYELFLIVKKKYYEKKLYGRDILGLNMINLPWIGKKTKMIAAPHKVTAPNLCQVKYITIAN
jgi:hypothetical protein